MYYIYTIHTIKLPVTIYAANNINVNVIKSFMDFGNYL